MARDRVRRLEGSLARVVAAEGTLALVEAVEVNGKARGIASSGEVEPEAKHGVEQEMKHQLQATCVGPDIPCVMAPQRHDAGAGIARAIARDIANVEVCKTSNGAELTDDLQTIALDLQPICGARRPIDGDIEPRVGSPEKLEEVISDLRHGLEGIHAGMQGALDEAKRRSDAEHAQQRAELQSALLTSDAARLRAEAQRDAAIAQLYRHEASVQRQALGDHHRSHNTSSPDLHWRSRSRWRDALAAGYASRLL